MIKLQWACIVLALTAALPGNAQTVATDVISPKGVRFEQGPTWSDIRTKAQKEGKYIFVDAFATWCGPCKLMDREVYPNDTVAAVMNAKFVSVRAQMDSSTQDRQDVVEWYADARNIRLKYRVTAYPTLLFFNPNGDLVYRSVGYNGVTGFLKTVNRALDPSNARYFSRTEAFREGKGEEFVSDTLAMYAQTLGQDSLAREIARKYIDRVPRSRLMTPSGMVFTADVARNHNLADSLFDEYKRANLNLLSDREFLGSKVNAELSVRFFNKMKSTDHFFRLCFDRPGEVDSVLGVKIAQVLVDSVVIHEEIAAKVHTANPDWTGLAKGIAEKYPGLMPGKLILDYQIRFYKFRKEWSSYARSVVRRVQEFGPYGIIPDEDFNLNNLAWEVFQYANDSDDLKIALSWSDRAVDIVSKAKDRFNLANWMDTNANLLYKLGRREQAIREETEAAKLNPKAVDIQSNLQDMKEGKATWKIY